MVAGANGLNGLAMVGNVVPVTSGIIVGGGGLVAMVHWTVTLRQGEAK